MTSIDTSESSRITAALDYIFAIAMMAVIAGILTTAMTLQYANGELPCPLCLLQRVAMFGVCFGLIQILRSGFSNRSTGISLLFALLLLIVSVRQTLLDIVPRPGHDYVGSAVFGLHMPVWSVIIALLILIAFAAKLAVLGGEAYRAIAIRAFPVLALLANMVSLYVLALCLINLVSVLLQCGFGQCHTFSYEFLP